MPIKAQIQTADLAAQNSFIGRGVGATLITMGVDDSYSVSVTGTFTGTIGLFRSLDGGTTWGTLDQSSGPIEWGGHVSSGCMLAVGFDSSNGGGFGNGSAHVIFKVGQ